MSDIVERLREFEISDALGDGDFGVCNDAADEIERLRGDLAETRIALANAEMRERMAKARLAEAGALLREWQHDGGWKVLDTRDAFLAGDKP